LQNTTLKYCRADKYRHNQSSKNGHFGTYEFVAGSTMLFFPMGGQA